MSQDQSLQPGTQLSGGKFVIDKLIARGGFSFIYEGRIIYQLNLDNELVGMQVEEKPVIIKELYNKDYAQRTADGINLAWNDENRPKDERFSEKIKSKTRSEAIKLRNLCHPNILHLIGAVEENNTIYQITQKIEGAVDLSKKLNLGTEVGQKLPLAQARKYILEVVQALRLVHSFNIIHLDIKPENILIDKDDRAILIDFGISMTLGGKDYQVSSIILNAASRPWAPLEQYSVTDRSSVGFESDIYALGQTIYALLTGIVPPDHTSIISGTATLVAPSEYNHEVSDYLDRVICKCIEAKRANRYQCIEEFERAFNGEKEYLRLITEAEKAGKEELWAEAIALLNEAETYVPLPYSLQEQRHAYVHSLSQREVAKHLEEAEQLIAQQAYAEAKQKLALLPQTKAVMVLLQRCNEELHKEHIANLVSGAEEALVSGSYLQAEALVEQVLAMAPVHQEADCLLLELRADNLLLKALEEELGEKSTPLCQIDAEVISLYGNAFNSALAKEQKGRLKDKHARCEEYVQKVNDAIGKVTTPFFQLGEQLPSCEEIHRNLSRCAEETKHQYALYQAIYTPLAHLPEVSDFLADLKQQATLYERIATFFANEEGTTMQEKACQDQQLRSLQKAVDYLDGQKPKGKTVVAMSRALRAYLAPFQEQWLAQERSKEHQALLKELEGLVHRKDFTLLAARLKSSDADCLTPEERKSFSASLPKRIPLLHWWITLIVLLLMAGIVYTIRNSEPSEVLDTSPLDMDSTIVIDIEKDSLARERETLEREAERLRKEEIAAAAIQKQKEEDDKAKKLKMEAEEKAKAERQRKEKEAKERAARERAARERAAKEETNRRDEANRSEAAQLVRRADALFAQRDLEAACQLYIKANRLSKGSGNVGASRFERLANSLSDDTSAPAYRNAKERAARIRMSN